MKLDKTNVCVFIADEAHLQQAMEFLERYNQPITDDGTYCFFKDQKNYLCTWINKEWFTSSRILTGKTPITLSELEQILKEEV